MVSKRGFPFSIKMSYCCPSKVPCPPASATAASASAFDVLTSFPNARVYRGEESIAWHDTFSKYRGRLQNVSLYSTQKVLSWLPSKFHLRPSVLTPSTGSPMGMRPMWLSDCTGNTTLGTCFQDKLALLSVLFTALPTLETNLQWSKKYRVRW